MASRPTHNYWAKFQFLPMYLVLGAASTFLLIYWGWQFTIANFSPTFLQGKNLGENCHWAIDAWHEGARPEELIQGNNYKWTAQSMPYRGGILLPPINANQFLLTRCELNVPAADIGKSVFLTLGSILGESDIFINNQFYLNKKQKGIVNLTVSPKDLVTLSPTLKVDVISRTSPGTNPDQFVRAGFATLQPLMATFENSEFVSNLFYTYFAYSADHTANRMGFLGAFLLIYIVAWIVGLRYADFGWMIGVCFILLLDATLEYRPFVLAFPTNFSYHRLLQYAAHAGLAGFLLSFARHKNGAIAGRIIFGTTLLWMGVYFYFPAINRNLFVFYSLPGITGSVVFSGVAAYLWQQSGGLIYHRRRRLRTISTLSGLLAVILLSDALLGKATVIEFGPQFMFIFTCAFAAYALADFVLFQNALFEERAAHAKTEAQGALYKAVATTTQMVIHDVRRPLQLIKSGSEVLAQETDPVRAHKRAKDFAKDLKSAVTAAENLIEDLLTASSEVRLQVSPRSIYQLLNEAVHEASSMHPNKDFTFDFSLHHLHMWLGDIHKMKRVITNILDNAMVAAPPGSMISIATREMSAPDGRLQIALSVSNCGPLIPAGDREKIFDLFFTSGKQGGTGLGLAIAKRIVEAHGGNISCEENAEGHTSFRLTLVRESTQLDSALSLPTSTGAAQVVLARVE